MNWLDHVCCGNGVNDLVQIMSCQGKTVSKFVTYKLKDWDRYGYVYEESMHE